MKVRSTTQLERSRRASTGPLALLTLFLASTFLGGTALISQAEDTAANNTGVSGTLVPESLRWKKGGTSLYDASNIVITGATLLPFSRIEPLYKNLREEPFKIRDIQGVMRQIARLYKQEGFLGVEVQLDLTQLENGIVAINIYEPEELKNDIIARSKGRELQTPKNPPVKVEPKEIIPEVVEKKEPSPREKVVKKAIQELKEPPKTRIEQRLSPENHEAKEVERHIFLLPNKSEMWDGAKDRQLEDKSPPKKKVIIPSENKNKEEQGVIKLLKPVNETPPELKAVPKAPEMIQEAVDPPPIPDNIESNEGKNRVYTSTSVDDKKKGRPEKVAFTIREYVATGNPLRPVKQAVVAEEDISEAIAAVPEKKLPVEAVYTRTSFIDQNTPDREDITFVERSDEHLLILEMMVNNRIRSRGIFSYLDEQGELLVPLFSFVEAMGFPIDVKPGAGLARGWFVEEGNTFQLSTADYNLVIGGKQLKYPTNQIEVHADDIYVHRQALEEWFGAQISLDMSQLRLLVNMHSTKLPYEDKWERRETWERVAESRKGSNRQGADIPFVDIPYKLVTRPVVKTNYSYDYNKTGDGETSDTLAGTLQMEGDVMYMTGNLSASFGKNAEASPKIYDVRFTLRRIDDEGNLPLNATAIEAGDINLSTMPLLATGKSGRGISFVRKPKGFVSNPEDFILEGFAPIGWDVELYLNQQLVDFQTVDSSGEYRFSNLALHKGNNVVKVITYGLDGEKRERVEHYYVGPGILTAGSFAYELSAIESSQRTLPVADISGVEDKRPSFLLSGDYGVTKDFFITGGVYHGPLLDDSEPESAVSAGVRATVFRNIYFTADASSQSMGGESAQAELQWIKENQTLKMSTRRNWSFLQAEENSLNTSSIGWTETLYPGFMHPINYGISYIKNTFLQGADTYTLSTNIATTLLGASFNNQLDSIRTANGGGTELNGLFTTSAKILDTTVRGKVGYDLNNAQDVVENVSFTGQKSINQDVTFNGLLTKTFGDTGELSGRASMRMALDKLTVALTAGAAESGNINAGIALTSDTLPVITADGGYTYESHGNKSSFNVARLNVRTFLDRDNDGKYSDGDDVLEGIAMKDERRGNESTTNRNGVATLKNLVPFTRTNIVMDVLTLPDIYYVPLYNRLQVEPRPGLAGLIDFPVTVKGEITGQVYVEGAEDGRSDTRAYIKLVDLQGNVIQELYVETGGVFIIKDIPVGKYFVQVSSTEEMVALTPAIPVEITFDSPVTDDLEFHARLSNKAEVYQ